jgi:hypothetical protein
MDCRHVQQELGSRSEVSAEVRRHIEDCEDCRLFAADLQAILELSESPVTTPTVLREQTLDDCRALLAGQTAEREMSLRQRLRAVWDSPQFIVAATALGLLIVGIMTIVQIKDDQDTAANLPLSLAIGQFVVQNFIAALFVPILLMMKRRLAGRTPQMGE